MKSCGENDEGMPNTTPRAAFYTLNIEDEEPVFLDTSLAERACIIVRMGCSRALVAFVVMPDHVHALFRADSIDTARDYSRLLNASFASIPAIYAHGLSDILSFPAEIERTKCYIEENPVRTGLCTTPQDYVWSSASKEEPPNFRLPDGGSWLPAVGAP